MKTTIVVFFILITSSISFSQNGLDKAEKTEVKSGASWVTPIKSQVLALANELQLDPTPALNYIENLPTLPEGVDGYFAIPKHISYDKSQKIISRKKSLEKFTDYYLVTQNDNDEVIKSKEIEKLSLKQKGDIVIIPVGSVKNIATADCIAMIWIYYLNEMPKNLYNEISSILYVDPLIDWEVAPTPLGSSPRTISTCLLLF